MNPQVIIDGLVAGSMIGLGAIGVTLTYSILRFANFAHGEFVTSGAYLTLVIAGALGAIAGAGPNIGPLSVSTALLAAFIAALLATGVVALVLDRVLFKPLRSRGATVIIVVIASFGASLAIRSLIEFGFTARPVYFNRDLQIAMPLGGGLRATPDQLFILAVTAALALSVHLLLTRTDIGRALRAVAENPSLASVVGIDVAKVVRVTWLLGGALACAAGFASGLLVQIRPTMGFDLLLPLFAAAILGGIGSVPGAMLGGLLVGLCEALAAQTVGAEWRAAVSFAVLVAVLALRPRGLFGRKA
ncbi:MAG: branched-chain amino acid ABC transporter permease [Pseudomonadota bacterium]